jgi:hypothetical protein
VGGTGIKGRGNVLPSIRRDSAGNDHNNDDDDNGFEKIKMWKVHFKI